jgi:acyl carrier protein
VTTDERIIGIIKQELGYVDAATAITRETTLEELGVDSLDLIGITIEIEETYGIEIGIEDELGWATVKDVIVYVKLRTSPR